MCKVLAARRCIGKKPSMTFLGKERSAVVHYLLTIYSVYIYICVCVCCINCICRCMSYLHLYFIRQPIWQSLANLSDWQLLHHVTDPNAHLVLHDIIQQLRQLRGGAFWEDLGFDYTAYFDVFCMFHSVVVFLRGTVVPILKVVHVALGENCWGRGGKEKSTGRRWTQNAMIL